jgi:hypothetical protein
MVRPLLDWGIERVPAEVNFNLSLFYMLHVTVEHLNRFVNM